MTGASICKRWPAVVVLSVSAVAHAEAAICEASSAGAAEPALAVRIDAFLAPYERGGNFLGNVRIGRGNRVVYDRSFGVANAEFHVPNSPATVFHIASVSKPFTASAILALAEEGKLRLDERITRFLPDFQPQALITIHHLLAHSSGIPNINDLPGYDTLARSPVTLDELIAKVRGAPLEFAPGQRFAYSNSNYNLLARIVENASGVGYGEYIKRRIVPRQSSIRHDGDPSALIEHRASGYMPVGRDDLGNAPYLNWSVKTGNGSLVASTRDLYQWECELHEGRILSRASVALMFRPYVGGVGYGWFITEGERGRVYTVNGRSPGFTAQLQRYADRDLVVVMTSNYYSALTQEIATQIARLALGEDVSPAMPPSPIRIDDALLKAAPGVYQLGHDFYNPDLRVTVRAADDGLWADTSAGDRIYLIALGGGEFLDRLYGGRMRFERSADGNIVALLWSFGRDFRAPRL